jgi:hypothetical protein
MNDILTRENKIGRVAGMERGKWYSLDLMITED